MTEVKFYDHAEEAGKENAQMPIVLELFKKLGLSDEYTRAEVICYDHATEKLVDKFSYEVNEREYDCAIQDLDKLEELLPKGSINEQFCVCNINIIRYRLNLIGQEEYQKNMLDVLALTIPLSQIQKKPSLFLGVQETLYIYNIANKISEQSAKSYIEILMKCMQTEKEYLKESHILLYELIMTWVASTVASRYQRENIL